MSARLYRRESTLARRFSQVCIVALTALITSSIGLLAYVGNEPVPGWLHYVVMVSAVMAAVSFVGWAVASLAQIARNRVSSR